MDLDGYPQSGSGYQRYWKNIFSRALIADLPKSSKMLVLGLGGGDIVKLLTNCQPNFQVTAVEIDQEIAQVAEKYFGIKESRRLRIIIEDAEKYMRANKIKYDLVIVDLYNGDGVPGFVSSAQFLREVAKALKPTRLAIFNYASHSFRERDFWLFEQKLQRVFADHKQYKHCGHPYYLASA